MLYQNKNWKACHLEKHRVSEELSVVGCEYIQLTGLLLKLLQV